MGYCLEKLVMHNFKLFSHAQIDIDGKRLVMLDGPNGYGKTSTFDALEYLFTGDVKRVSANGVSKSNIGFEEDCLIKSPSDGTLTYVKGIFCNEDNEQLEIKRELPRGKGAANNPSKIKSRTKTTVVWKGKDICKEEDVEKANEQIMRHFGMSILNYYDQFYYIAQEGRLKFLSKSESDRIQEIQILFGIKDEEETLLKIKKTLSKFSDLNKAYLKKVDNKKTEINKLQGEVNEKDNVKNLVYKDLVGDKDICPVWNQQKLQINNKEKLSEMAESIRAAGMFSRDIGWYKKDIINTWIDEKIEDKEMLKKYLYLNSHFGNLEYLKEDLQQYYEITYVLEQAKTVTGGYDYEKYDFKTLKQFLDLKIDLNEIEHIREDINVFRKNVKEEDTARASITALQEKMKIEWEAWQSNGYEGLEDNQCPLCGHPYDNKIELIQALDSYKHVIEKGKGTHQKQIEQKITDLEEKYNTYCKQQINQYLNEHESYKNVICEQLYKDWDKISREYNEFLNECGEYKIPNNYSIKEEDFDKAEVILERFIIALKGNKYELPDGYCRNRDKYQYKNVLSLDYKNKLEKVQFISEADVEEKIQYVQQEYYGCKQKELDDKQTEFKTIEEQAVKIAGVEESLKELKSIVEDKLKDYKEKLVKQLKIPFYLYTGRILQNYPGGLGIWMDFANNEKIRFEAERRKGHDVLYTLSSGQLSAIAIAISLTLNKIYAQEGMRCMFIDDPIQTMDELNIASFTEVLRTDFSEYQFVLSTHENDFSDYIRYKYEKYGLSNCSIEVRDMKKA